MEIAICDDEPIILEMTAKAIMKYCKQRNFAPHIYLFQSVRSLINYKEDLDIIFLDIEFPDCDGIELSGQIQERHKEAKIVLLTNYTNRYKDGYKIKAFRFMTKPLDEEELEECMTSVRKELGKVFAVLKDGCDALIRERDIYYLSAENGFTEIWSENDAHRSYESLAAWEERLSMGETFCRCHKKYIVNLGHIEEINSDDKAILMDNGMKILVSRRKLKELKDCFMYYDVRNG